MGRKLLIVASKRYGDYVKEMRKRKITVGYLEHSRCDVQTTENGTEYG